MSDSNNGELREFQLRAEQYCDWVRGVKNGSGTDIMREAERLLASLHLAWIGVPRITGELTDVEVQRDDSAAIHRMFCKHLPVDGYLTVPDSFDFDDKANPYMGSLTDDLGDIYGDLQEGLVHWKEGRPYDAYFQWNLTYWHWGQHLTSAQKALFDYFRDPDEATRRRQEVWNDATYD